MRIACLLAAVSVLQAAAPNVDEIVKKSTANMERNWQAAPHYTYLERDVETKRGGAQVVKTHWVFVIEGSQYNRLIAINDQPLSKQDDQREEQKLQAEIARRKHESPSERAKRVAKYAHERQQDHLMLMEMVHAFSFKLLGDQKVNGRDAWILEAMPRPDYQPNTREGKVLAGMRGKMWVDKEELQWLKVTAEVVRPVSMYVVAKVSPGTKFFLEQAPVGNGLWFPKRFDVNVVASALGFINEDSTDYETYSHYRPMPSESQMLALGFSGN
ncbi:MAG: hypothetical protein JO022_16985 [Acidobacteriaceae bacterium]|nr:hypothetical protein [Acidobacteriaceae bacterium]